MPRHPRRFRPAAPAGDFQPMLAINTTPLIDLMLVLLILFLITVPVQTHKVPVDLPTGTAPPEPRPVHVLSLDAAGRLAWDGAPIADAGLAPRLAALRADPRGPELHLGAAAETRYERFDETLAAIRRAGIERLGFVGNQRFAEAI